MNAKTQSERLFENCLKKRGLDFQFEPTFAGVTSHPDYAVFLADQEVLCEIKEFVAPRLDLKGTALALDPYRAIREKIGAARKKFKHLKQYPCCLVLYNNAKPGVFIDSTEFGRDFIFAAMLGDIELHIPAGAQPPGETAHGVLSGRGGKMVHKAGGQPVNTTISGIVVLEHLNVGLRRLLVNRRRWEKSRGRDATKLEFYAMIEQADGTIRDVSSQVLRAVVYENPHARLSVPEQLFNGPYDERYGIRDDQATRAFAGEEIKKLEAEENELTGGGPSDLNCFDVRFLRRVARSSRGARSKHREAR